MLQLSLLGLYGIHLEDHFNKLNLLLSLTSLTSAPFIIFSDQSRARKFSNILETMKKMQVNQPSPLQQCQNKRQRHQTNHHHAASDSNAGRFETSTFLVLKAVAFLIPKR